MSDLRGKKKGGMEPSQNQLEADSLMNVLFSFLSIFVFIEWKCDLVLK